MNNPVFHYLIIENNKVILKSIPATEDTFIYLSILRKNGIVWKNITGHLCSNIDLSNIIK